tara:strand:+ start:2561 stop:2755 length:195 start_codon:yes stop_codon:yes gene_type:complete
MYLVYQDCYSTKVLVGVFMCDFDAKYFVDSRKTEVGTVFDIVKGPKELGFKVWNMCKPILKESE